MVNPIKAGILEGEKEIKELSDEESVLLEFYGDIDPLLRKEGWSYLPAKSVEFGKIDQSLLNHIRNGVSFLSQFKNVLNEIGIDFDRVDLKRTVSLFILHDLHKLEDKDWENEFNIDKKTVKKAVYDLTLDNFSDLDIEDYYSCVKASHRSSNSKTGRLTPEYSRLAPLIRLADAMASSPSPGEAASYKNQEILKEKFDNLEFSFHKLEEVKGISTNILNRSIADYLETKGHHILTIYDNGCLYLKEKNIDKIDLNEKVFNAIYDNFVRSLRKSHENLNDPSKLSQSIKGGRLGHYNASSEYYFYSGIENIIKGFCFKGASDADSDNDLTDSMISDIELAEEVTEIEIDKKDRTVIGFARIVASIYKQILSLENDLDSGLKILGEIFNADNSTKKLMETNEKQKNELESGGKWIYSIPIAQEFLESEIDGKKPIELETRILSEYISEGVLNKIDKEKIESKLVGDFEKEIKSFISDIVILNNTKYDFEIPDIFDEYISKRNSKLCSICNRSTFGNKSDMESKKSLHGLQAGFSNYVDLGASKPENLLLCKACQVEFGLRNIEINNEQEYRIFYHFIPDYFYTPVTWSIAENIVQIVGNGKSQVLNIANTVISGEFNKNIEEDFENLAGDESGLSVLESTIGEFKNNYGTQILEYHRNSSNRNPLNDTSVHFLGIFTGLVAAQLSGSRVVITKKPINPYPSTSFKEFANIDCGKNQVLNITGTKVPLSEIEDRLKALSSIIRIGYSIEMKDSLFAQHLRICRNNDLPGSYLLKKALRSNDNESQVIGNHLNDAYIIDLNFGDNMTKNKLDKLAELGFRVAIPKTYKPYAVERPFRESVKAITKIGIDDLGEEDYKNLVAGRLRKGLERGSQTFSKSKEDLGTEKGWGERIDEFAEYFVEEIFYGICDGNPGKLKRKSNNMADAYYSGVLKRKNRLK